MDGFWAGVRPVQVGDGVGSGSVGPRGMATASVKVGVEV